MKLAICSDLHLDHRDLSNTFYENLQGAEILIMAGDTIESRKLHTVRHVFERVSELYKWVVIISGNHEFYGSAFNKSKEDIREFIKDFRSVIYLDNQSLNLDSNTVLIGSTLWTDYNNKDPLTQLFALDYMNDHKYIETNTQTYNGKLHPLDCYDYHKESKEFIRDTLESNPSKKVIVVTHHAPSFQSINPYFIKETLGNGCYASALDGFIHRHKNIALWVHGHIHYCNDYHIGSCRVVSHPRGYPREIDKDYYYDYKPLVVEV